MSSLDDDCAWINFLPLKRRKTEKNTKTTNAFKRKRKAIALKTSVLKFDAGISRSERCPSCQLPFDLIETSQKFQHVSQCLDADKSKIAECEEGKSCNSIIASHFKDFTHFQLAEYRATELQTKCNSKMEFTDSNCNEIYNILKTETKFEDLKIENINNAANNCENLKSETFDIDCKFESLMTESISTLNSSDSQKENDGNQKMSDIKKDQKQLDIRRFFDNWSSKAAEIKEKPMFSPTVKVINSSETSLISDVKLPVQLENKWWSKKRKNEDENESLKVPKYRKECPFYKKITNTAFAVDAFSYGEIPNIKFYFLTHFHSDHYQGLNGKFKKPIYCSQVTANLISMNLHVSWKFINVVPLNEPIVIDGSEITFLEANHCPGSVLILFQLPNGHNILHTGDFRAHEIMESYNAFQNINIDVLYLDTTYCNPKYDFPSQEAVVYCCINIARRYINEQPKTLFVCGSYTIGKEKIFMGIAQELKLKVYGSVNKLKVLSKLEDPSIIAVLANDWEQAQVHVLPMQQLNYKALHEHLQRYAKTFTNIVAIKPTGWEYRKNTSLEEIKPRCSGNVHVYGIPYSEHSSYLELRRFIQFFHPSRIIPTVNVGRVEDRERMQGYFRQWIKSN